MPVILKKPTPQTDGLWAISIEIKSEPLQDASAYIVFKAYNSQNGLIDNARIETLKVDSVADIIALDPQGNMAKAYHFLVLAMNDEYKRQNGL